MGNRKILQSVKHDMALEPTSLASTVATGEFYKLADYKKCLCVAVAGAMAAAETVALQLRSATDAIGTGAADIAGALATMTGNVNVQEILINFGTIIDTDALVINGVTFTCEDTTPVAANGEFASGADDDAAQVNLAAVVALLLGDTVLLTPDGAGGTGVLTAKEPGAGTVSASSGDATIIVTTNKAQCFVEVDAHDLPATGTHVAAEVTTVGTIIAGATMVRAGHVYDPSQQAAASTIL